METEGKLMETFTGKYVDPLNLLLEDICIEDIAHSLALQCRYQGHCKFFYSVGQHCLAGLEFIEDEYDNRLAWLLHDATEAYLHDIVHAVKDLIPSYKAAEFNAGIAIYEKFGVHDWYEVEIKRVDYGLMAYEAQVLMNNTDHWTFPVPVIRHTVKPMAWYNIERMFLEAFCLLVSIKGSRSKSEH